MSNARTEEPKKTAKIDLHFVTGKGGVGKSTVAAALALSLAKAGKKCLLVELGNQSFYKDYFELDEVGYFPKSLKPGLDIALWSGPECLKEYARHLLKIESLYKLFFENPVTRSLVNIAPALPELAILGKITSGPPRNVGPAMPYDCLVIDAYATGHFLALLRAPLGMSKAVRFGPMSEQSRSIHEIICSAAQSHYYVVSLPEELPVTEALELSKSLESQVGFRPIQILNHVLEGTTDSDPSQTLQPPSLFNEAMRVQTENVRNSQERLKEYKLICLPFVLENQALSVVESLATEFSTELADV